MEVAGTDGETSSDTHLSYHASAIKKLGTARSLHFKLSILSSLLNLNLNSTDERPLSLQHQSSMSAPHPPSQPPPSSASAPPSLPARLAAELGVPALLSSPLDTKLLLLQRFLRLFAYGGSTLVLVLYLRALGISSSQIGLFMSLTLLGDVLISFLLTLFADGLGRRVVLAVGAGAMVGSGVVFACSGNYWVLLGAAVVGVISPRSVQDGWRDDWDGGYGADWGV